MDKFLTAGTSGCLASCLLYPIDTIKVRIQNNNKILFRNLYKGFRFNICCIFPEKAFQIGTYEYMRSNNYSLLQSSIAASTMQCVISTPRDLVKIRLQNNVINNFKDVYYNKVNIYRGLHFNLIRECTFGFCFFSFYENLKVNYNPFMSGCISAMASCLITSPIDVIKTRYQVSDKVRIIDTLRFHKSDLPIIIKSGCLRAIMVGSYYGITMLGYELLNKYI